MKSLCLIQLRASLEETEGITTMLTGLFKYKRHENKGFRVTFGSLHAKTQQVTLKVFSPGIEELQDELHAYCNLAGIRIISFPELSTLLFFSKKYRNEELPCERRSMEAKGLFTEVEPIFTIDIMNTVHCLNQHINSDSESETDDEEELSQVSATVQEDDNDGKDTEAVTTTIQDSALLREQRVNVSRYPILKRKAIELPENAKFMRSYARHEPQLDVALLEMMTETSEEREYEEDNQLLNECKDDDEMYEMKGETLCNMTIPVRRAVINNGRHYLKHGGR